MMNCQERKFLTPPSCGNSRRFPPTMPLSEKKWSSPHAKRHLFHVLHKVPAGDSPYVRAKHVQLIDKDPSKAISLFWAAINSGDRVDSALKDMAVVMKQLNRADEAIEAIKSFRHLCPAESQESLDNLLVELYKRSGRIEDQIEMLELKVKSIEEGIAFAGKRTKCSRSQGKKILITIEQEYSRLLGNLAWAYLQKNNYKSAEELYRKALSLEQDKNKQCNLAICLMHMNRMTEARFLLQTIRNKCDDEKDYESFAKSYERATQVLAEIELQKSRNTNTLEEMSQVKGTGSDHSFPTSINLNFGSFGSEDCPETFSTHISSVDRFQKGSSYQEHFYGRHDAFMEKTNDRWVRDGATEDCVSWRKPYTPLVPGREIQRVPYTQPKRAPSPFIGRDQRTGAVLGHCSRKLSFDQTSGRESMQLSSSHSTDGQPCISGDWRKKSLEDHSIPQIISGRSAGQKNLILKGKDLATKATDPQKCDGSSGAFAENIKAIQESTVKTQRFQISSCQSRRTWADIVEEEEEQELLSGRTDECDEWDRGEEFSDENVNSNIRYQAFTPSEKLENMSQKLASCDMKDGYRTQPESITSKDRFVRRSLCFGQEEDNRSPLRNVALNFEGHHRFSRSGTKQLRRNRLQVFRDITPSPESPRDRI